MSNPKGVNLSFRKTWDSTDFASKESSRSQSSRVKVLPIAKESLKPHSEAELEQSVTIRSQSGSTAGYFRCDVCDMGFHDSISYLEHINGRKHQRRLGRKMEVESSSLEHVAAVLKTSTDEPMDSSEPKISRIALLEQKLRDKRNKSGIE
ncbi:hypothetical protein RCL1_006587 [Eukaryota sp. TZLM3-RCL]